MHTLTRTSLALAFVIASASAATASEVPPDAVPLDGVIHIADHGWRDWGPALVTYRADPDKFPPGKVALTDSQGHAVPINHLPDGTLRFVATVAKGTTQSWKLAPGEPLKTSALTRAPGGGGIELGNGLISVRVPEPGQHAGPAAAADVPGPILAWKPADQPWMGATRFTSARQVEKYETKLEEEGPARIACRTTYHFVGGGAYTALMELSPGIAYAIVTEEFDLPDGKPEDALLLNLGAGQKPGDIGVVAGEDGHMQREPADKYRAGKVSAAAQPPAPLNQGGTPPVPPPAPGLAICERIIPGIHFAGTTGGFEVRPDAAKPGIAMVPLHCGQWRRALGTHVWTPKEGDALFYVALPIAVRPATWYSEVTDDISPFSTHEHDPSLPATYGRRVWALACSEHPELIQRTDGYIGLDAFKGWVLIWPETVTADDYPRAHLDKATRDRLKGLLEQHPDRKQISALAMFGGDRAAAASSSVQAISGAEFQIKEMGGFNAHGASHYRWAQALGPVLLPLEDGLSNPALSAEQRAGVRQVTALAAYCLSDPDVVPRGAGVHLGNNNMPIVRMALLPLLAAMLPDHPCHKQWMQDGATSMRFRAAAYFAPDGVVQEPPTYQLYGPLRAFMLASAGLRSEGITDLDPYITANLRYLAHLSTPDWRYDGHRALPGMGNSAAIVESIFGTGIDIAARVDPAIAGLLAATNQAAWPNAPLATRIYSMLSLAMNFRPDIASTATAGSAAFPTYGAMLRSQPGTPRETTVLVRAGTNWGHWDTDELNLLVYGAGGAPISPGTGYQYYSGGLSQNNGIYHNRCKLGDRYAHNLFGRADGGTRSSFTGKVAGWVDGQLSYTKELFTDNHGPAAWRRRVLMVNAEGDEPVAVLVRDSFPGGAQRPAWFYWMNLGDAGTISVDGKAFDPSKNVADKIQPPDAWESKHGEAIDLHDPSGGVSRLWLSGGARTIRVRGMTTYDTTNSARLGLQPTEFPKMPPTETKTQLEIEGKGEDGFLTVLQPLVGDKPAVCSSPAPGVTKIVWNDGTIDWVRIADDDTAFEGDGVLIKARVASVRVAKNRVAIALPEGGTAGYQNMLLTAKGPAEKSIPRDQVAPGTTDAGGVAPQWQESDLGGGLIVRGPGPFTATLDGQTIRIKSDGAARTLWFERPTWMNRPWYTVDKTPFMACFTDYPDSGWGTYADARSVALTVPAGAHELAVSNWSWVQVWPRRWTPALAITPAPAKGQ